MEKRINLAGIPIEIHTLFDSLINTEEYETEETAAFTVSTTEQDIIAEQKKSIAECAYDAVLFKLKLKLLHYPQAVKRKIARILGRTGR